MFFLVGLVLVFLLKELNMKYWYIGIVVCVFPLIVFIPNTLKDEVHSCMDCNAFAQKHENEKLKVLFSKCPRGGTAAATYR